jgi:hypothetical protein
MPTSERRHRFQAVKNTPFTGVILAKAAFLGLDGEKSDRRGRNNNTAS